MSSFFSANPELRKVKFLLGSKSPRRKELIQMIDIEASVVEIDVDEDFPEDILNEEVAEYLAKKKSGGFIGGLNDHILITSDTVVLCKGKILNKPADRNEAIEMLRLLSNTKHEVHTGVCLRTTDKQLSFNEATQVFFRELTEQEIEYYIDEYKPMDKAGSYGIQEWLGAIGIERIEGCYYNVMGLPTQRLYSELCDFIKKNF